MNKKLTNALYVVLICADAEGHNCLFLWPPAHGLNERRDLTADSHGSQKFVLQQYQHFGTSCVFSTERQQSLYEPSES